MEMAFVPTPPAPASFLPVLGALALILIGARLGGSLARRLGLPEVLGELLAGVVIGNLGLVGITAWHALRDLPGLDLLAEIGVLFLLFVTGLESDLSGLLEVGASSFLVASLGVLTPIALGTLAAIWLDPARPLLVHLFAGATLCATSVGITARVLRTLGRAASPTGRIVLGAAVIDDVLGLVVLAVISGLIRAENGGGAFHAWTALAILAKAAAFLAGALMIGRWISRRSLHAAARGGAHGLVLSLALGACFGLAWLAGMIGLAPIVGAFAAGVALEGGPPLIARDGTRRTIAQAIAPIVAFLSPIFFVLIGARVNLAAFARPGVPALALALTLAAVLGKLACSLGVIDRTADRWAVGFGMIPRGEVGLIFAGIGAGLWLAGERVVDERLYAAIVGMVLATTLIGPPLLAWRARRAT